MNAPEAHDWQPDPQLLGAYFDGEMEGRDSIADVRARLEVWLEAHPEVRALWADQQALRRMWLDTTPREPSAATWNEVLDRIDAERRRPMSPPVRRYRRMIGAIAAGVALLMGLAYGTMRYVTPGEVKNDVAAVIPHGRSADDDEAIFPVATSAEVIVTYIEGADIRALAVGQLPVQGSLELADIGEVRFIAVRSDAEPRMQPQARHDGPNRPMVWVPLEEDD